MKKSALVLVADGCEEIETVTVVDVLRRAHVEATLAAAGASKAVKMSRGVLLVADVLLSEFATPQTVEAFDAIILPGGLKGAQAFSSDAACQTLLRAFDASGTKLVAAMCASTTALHAAGVGRGKRATSYPAFREQLASFYDYQETPVAIDTHLITSRAPGTAMAWALAIVQELCGQAKAHEVAKQLHIMFPFD